jgi:predicted SAM-dependent methyltransferase
VSSEDESATGPWHPEELAPGGAGARRAMGSETRLNLGCGGRPLPGYLNVDADSLAELRARYPQSEFPVDLVVYNFDIFSLPFADDSVAEVRADSLIEHLGFIEERKFFYEVKRVLRPGGLFRFSTPDFEDAVRLWLAAKDEWKDFYRNDAEAIANNHWFGQYSYGTENRWGYLMAMIFGSQHGAGQFHKNCYTVPKIRAILTQLDFVDVTTSHYRWKGDRDLMIAVQSRKR